MSIIKRIIEWLFPPRRLRISDNVPWNHDDVRRAVRICLDPFFWPAIDNHGIHIMMRNNPANNSKAAGATDGYLIFLDSDLVNVPLSETALAHELEHVRQVMLGNPRWADHTEEFFQMVSESEQAIEDAGL
jgi:hypothetical protein